MDIFISNSSDKPIYNQIASQIKNLIITDKLKVGDSLPSMRFLAKELRISVITTKRAYDELEKEGFIETVSGKGCFVAGKNFEIIREEKLRLAEEHIKEAVDISKIYGITLKQLEEIMTILYGDE